MKIHLDAFSLVEDGAVCVQMMQSFELDVHIPMTSQRDGLYTVLVSGK